MHISNLKLSVWDLVSLQQREIQAQKPHHSGQQNPLSSLSLKSSKRPNPTPARQSCNLQKHPAPMTREKNLTHELDAYVSQQQELNDGVLIRPFFSLCRATLEARYRNLQLLRS
jgi:hypothetical protein